MHLSLVQQGEEQEDHAGEINLLWEYSSDQVATDEWFEGQVEVRAPWYEETAQNYTVGYTHCSI